MGRRDDLDASLLPLLGPVSSMRGLFITTRGAALTTQSRPSFFAHAGYMSRVHSPTLAIRTAPVLAAFVGR
jgi:hypothetical protein